MEQERERERLRVREIGKEREVESWSLTDRRGRFGEEDMRGDRAIVEHVVGDCDIQILGRRLDIRGVEWDLVDIPNLSKIEEGKAEENEGGREGDMEGDRGDQFIRVLKIIEELVVSDIKIEVKFYSFFK
jgi:hypothetical protein